MGPIPGAPDPTPRRPRRPSCAVHDLHCHQSSRISPLLDQAGVDRSWGIRVEWIREGGLLGRPVSPTSRIGAKSEVTRQGNQGLGLRGAHHKTGAPRGVVGYDRADDRSRERVAAEVARGLPSLYAAGRPSSLAFRADTTTSAAPPSARTLLSRLCRGVLSMSEPRTSSTEGAGRP